MAKIRSGGIYGIDEFIQALGSEPDVLESKPLYRIPSEVGASNLTIPTEQVQPNQSTNPYQQILEQPSARLFETIDKVKSQFNEGNYLAATLNTILGAGETALSPLSTAFSLGTQAIKDVGLEPVATALEKPFEYAGNLPSQSAQEITDLLENSGVAQKLRDLFGKVESERDESGFRTGTSKQLQDVKNAIEGISGLSSQLVLGKVIHSGQKGLKKGFDKSLDKFDKKTQQTIDEIFEGKSFVKDKDFIDPQGFYSREKVKVGGKKASPRLTRLKDIYRKTQKNKKGKFDQNFDSWLEKWARENNPEIYAEYLNTKVHEISFSEYLDQLDSKTRSGKRRTKTSEHEFTQKESPESEISSRKFLSDKPSELVKSKQDNAKYTVDREKLKKGITSKILELIDFKNETSGQFKRVTNTRIKNYVSLLRQNGINAKYDLNGNKLIIDGQTVRKPRAKVVRDDIGQWDIKNPAAKKPFEKLSNYEQDKQTAIAEFFQTKQGLPDHLKSKLPRGFGEAKIQKGLKDIKDDAGKEQNKEAQIVRDFVKEIESEIDRQGFVELENGMRINRDEIDSAIESEVERKGIQLEEGDVSFEFSSKQTKKPVVEKTKAGDQFTLGSQFKPSMPSKRKFEGKEDLSEETPLFQQAKADINQEDFFKEKTPADYLSGETPTTDIMKEAIEKFGSVDKLVEEFHKTSTKGLSEVDEAVEFESFVRNYLAEEALKSRKISEEKFEEGTKEKPLVVSEQGKSYIISDEKSSLQRTGRDLQGYQKPARSNIPVEKEKEGQEPTKEEVRLKDPLTRIYRTTTGGLTRALGNLYYGDDYYYNLNMIDNLIIQRGGKHPTVKYEDMLKARVPKDVNLERYISEEIYKKDVENIKNSPLNVGLNPEVMASYVRAGAYHLENILRSGVEKGRQFKIWINNMVHRFGEGIRKRLRSIWKGMQNEFGKKLIEFSEKNPFNKSTMFAAEGNFSDFVRNKAGKSKPPKAEAQGEIFEGRVTLPAETKAQRVQRKFQDALNRSEQLVKQAQKISPVDDEINFRQKAELYPGRVANEIENRIEKPLYDHRNKDNFFKKLAKSGYTLEDLGTYLYAQHAPFRNEYISRNVNPDIENGSGLSTEDVQNIMTEYENTAIPDIAKEFRSIIIDPHLKLLRESGLISEESYNKFKTNFKMYIPLKGMDLDVEIEHLNFEPGKGQGFSTHTTGIKTAKGRASVASSNPATQAIHDYYNTIIRSEKNKVAQSFANFVRSFPNEDLYELTPNKSAPLLAHEFAVYEKGKRRIIAMKDEALARGLKNLGIDKTYKILTAYNSFKRGFITQYNPFFAVRNFQRDIQAAMFSVSAEVGVKVAGKALADVPNAMKTIWNDKEFRKSTPLSKIYQEFKADGVKTGWTNQMTLAERTKDFNRKLELANKKAAFRKSARVIADYISDVNETVELAVRFSTYKALRDQGWTREKAANYAKNMTVNFNKKGEYGNVINTSWLFSNAGMQGSKRIWDVLKSKRGRRYILSGLLAAGIVQNILNRWIDEENYKKIPDWEKDMNWIFMIGNGGRIKVPMGYGYNVIPAFSSTLTDYIMGDITESKALSRVVDSFVNAFNPLGNASNFIESISPTILRTPVQISMNMDWTGKPIQKENQFKYVPEYKQYFESVSDVSRVSTEAAYKITKGKIDINPEIIDHIVGAELGGVGQEVMNLIQTSSSILKAEKPEVRKIPIVRNLYAEPYEYYERSKVYELLEDSESTLFTDKNEKEFLNLLNKAYNKGHIKAGSYKNIKKRYYHNQRLQKKLK